MDACQKFMEEAVNEAYIGVSQGDGGPFGAIVVQNGKIVARGHNQVLRTNDPTAHAEVTAIRAASKALGSFNLSGCVLYTSCFPCPMCMGAVLWARLDLVYYAATTLDAAGAGFDDQKLWEIVKNHEQSTLFARVVIVDYMKPFDLWNRLAEKCLY